MNVARPPDSDRSGAGLLRSVGLMADGPVVWGRPVPGRGPGIFLVELPDALPSAPLEATRIGKWIERVPGLRLDGEPPTAKTLAARLASFWLPEARVLYVGATTKSIGGRAANLMRHVLGDGRPHADGQWLHTIRGPEVLRLWWATTDATEEYLDAILDAFSASHTAVLAARPADAMTLPWANTRRPTGERQPSGITGATLPVAVEPPPPPTRRVDVAAGDADGVRRDDLGSGTRRRTGDPASLRPGSSPRRAATLGRAVRPRVTASPRPTAAAAKEAQSRRKSPPEPHTAASLERLRSELDELTRVQRPEVVARIKAARELGDLRENSEYHAARAEQSFLEGRVQTLEERLRNAVLIEEPDAGAGVVPVVRLGSVVTVEVAGEELTYSVVGSNDADLAAGRISTASPVGAALLGSRVGQDVQVRTPRGPVAYRVISIE
ncbi:MAG: transcription elongation factor GreA [Chloroflexota bacterium]